MAARRSSTAREWALAIGGGLGLAAALIWLLRGGDDVPPPIASPPPPMASAPPPMASAPPPVAAAAPTDLALTGLRAGPDGGMAIISAGGRQYLLRPGRSLPGGLKLLRVEPARAVLAGPTGEIVLAFADAAPTATAQPPGGDPTPWRLALSPLRADGRLAGWRLDTVAGLPALARAGLQPGDVLLSANGNELISEEKIMELPQELAANGRLQIAYRRGNNRREATVTP